MRHPAHLGDAESAGYTQAAGAAAGAATAGAAAAGLISASAAGPIGAAIAGITLAISALIANSGCGPTCILATRIVDQLEPQLRANRDAYLAGPRTAELQSLALANFDATWAWLTSPQALGSPDLGDAGKRGITDRGRGGKWDWFAYYRDPIADDRPLSAPALEVAGIPSAWLMAAALLILLGVIL